MQAFVRDPDGYYIEFCSCSHLEDSLNPVKFKDHEWSLFKSIFVTKVSSQYFYHPLDNYRILISHVLPLSGKQGSEEESERVQADGGKQEPKSAKLP